MATQVLTLQQKRATANKWTTSYGSTVLLAGEIGFETDTFKFKIGDGVKTWVALPYATNIDPGVYQSITTPYSFTVTPIKV